MCPSRSIAAAAPTGSLALTGLASTGPARTGLVSTGPASTGLASTGPVARLISASDGPQVGQHAGSAWKRRFPGSPYSAAQAGHIVNPAIVVLARSYGTSRTIVNRGPQLVQLMNG